MAENAALTQLAELRGSLELYAPKVLRLKTKSGETEPFVFNEAQIFLHQKLEAQLAEFGWVRALILKGRQQGVSTYTAGRFYHRASLRRGRNVYILAHEAPAAQSLFGIVDRYHRHAGMFAPHVGRSNVKELEFDRLDSSYTVATAGKEAGGRSKTTHLFHGSEVAFWPNAADHFAASVQTVPLEPGTEIILESTSAGAGGEFYERCLDAQAGRGDYILVFIPWWLSPEYRRTPPPGFVLSSEEVDGDLSEAEYAELYGVPIEAMVWRRAKMIELRDPLLFRREYPATVEDAWTAPPGHEPYINSLTVLRARKRRDVAAIGPLIIGVDPASGGGDRFAVAWRRGLKVIKVEYRNKINHEEAVAWLRKIIDEDRPARMNIDAGNIGANVVTSLKNLGAKYVEIVRGVNFGGTSEHRNARPKVPGPYNRRAEMWKRLLEWLELPEGASLPDDGALQADITAPKQQPRLDNFFMLESKIDMKKRGIRSPDLADAVCLTFAFMEFFERYYQPDADLAFGNVDDRAQSRVIIPTAEDYAQLELGPQSWMA